ncbi:MAG: hypothetical protein Q4B26_08460 [Eubacteriales bacterium]|nr:hypothetical protein [Eubacteriales bacterium]
MAMNPAMLLQMRERLQIFERQHPKVPMFIKDVGNRAFQEGAVLELKVTDPDGRTYVTNMRVTEEDVKTFSMFKGMN